MTNLNTLSTLDTVIAIVIVLLVLSLIVQAIQTVIKKLFKIKSGTILNSLQDLFKYIDISATAKSPKELVEELTAELKKLGRVSFRGNLMIDSIAKDDLIKILQKMGHDDLVPNVEAWFETVMQSFEERYTRHMKSVAVCISLVVVVYLNANFFRIYRDLSTSDVRRALVAEQAPNILGRVEHQEELEEAGRVVAGYIGDYESFGFSPLTWDQTCGWFRSLGGQTLLRDERGRPVNVANEAITKDCVQVNKEGNSILGKDGKTRDCERVWRPMTSQEWWASRRQDANGLLGWGVMALLLSVGAPFWQDALESLFGIKTLLRKKSETKNVEEQKGGQPKP